MRGNLTAHGLAAATLLYGAAAIAAPSLQNGGFESSSFVTSTEFGASYSAGQGVTGWTSPSASAFNLYWLASQALAHADIRNDTRFPGEAQQITFNFNQLSPNGGNFVALDGDTDYNGPLQQSISGLTPGGKYTVAFSWAAIQLTNRTGETTERFDVSLGSQTLSTATLTNPTQGFSGWKSASLTFTASAATELLSFLSVGTPNGLPPVALLDGVSLTEVPEPGTIALLGAGMLAVGALRRRAAKA